MIKKLEKITSLQIIGFSALLLITVFLCRGFMGYFAESSARKDGALEEYTLQAKNFEWSSFKREGEKMVPTDNDPQLILNVEQKMISVRFTMESSLYPGEVVLYYTEPGDIGFSERKRVWATGVDGHPDQYLFEMPLKTVTSLRIDPTMYAGNRLELKDFVFNEENTLSDYLRVSTGTMYNFVLYTGIISSVLKYLLELITRKFD